MPRTRREAVRTGRARWTAVAMREGSPRRPNGKRRLGREAARREPRERPVGRAEPEQPGDLAPDRAPGADVVERRGEESDGVREREQVADPARRRDDLLRDEPDEDDR